MCWSHRLTVCLGLTVGMYAQARGLYRALYQDYSVQQETQRSTILRRAVDRVTDRHSGTFLFIHLSLTHTLAHSLSLTLCVALTVSHFSLYLILHSLYLILHSLCFILHCVSHCVTLAVCQDALPYLEEAVRLCPQDGEFNFVFGTALHRLTIPPPSLYTLS